MTYFFSKYFYAGLEKTGLGGAIHDNNRVMYLHVAMAVSNYGHGREQTTVSKTRH